MYKSKKLLVLITTLEKTDKVLELSKGTCPLVHFCDTKHIPFIILKKI